MGLEIAVDSSDAAATQTLIAIAATAPSVMEVSHQE